MAVLCPASVGLCTSCTAQLHTLSCLERRKQDPCWEEGARWYFIYTDIYKHCAGFCLLRCRQETIMLFSTLWDYTAKILQNAITSWYYFLIASPLQLIYNRNSLLYSYFFIETIALKWSSLWNILSKIHEGNHAWAPKSFDPISLANNRNHIHNNLLKPLRGGCLRNVFKKVN